MRRWGIAVALVLMLLASPTIRDARACPNCREAVANDASDAGRQAIGFGWSILFMMAMPFTLLGAGSVMVVRAVRRGGLPEL